jgi:hypothetical protein
MDDTGLLHSRASGEGGAKPGGGRFALPASPRRPVGQNRPMLHSTPDSADSVDVADNTSVLSAHSASTATASLLGKQRELVMRVQTLSEENRVLKQQWKQAVSDLETAQGKADEVISKVVPNAALIFAKWEAAQQRVRELEKQLEASLDGAPPPLSATGEEKEPSSGPAAMAPAVAQVLHTANVSGFSSSWNIRSIFPVMQREWTRVAWLVALLLPVYSAVQHIREALLTPVIQVGFSPLAPGAFDRLMELSTSDIASVYLPLAVFLCLALGYAWAAVSRRSGNTWLNAPLALSVVVTSIAMWTMSFWPVVSPIPEGTLLSPDSVLWDTHALEAVEVATAGSERLVVLGTVVTDAGELVSNAHCQAVVPVWSSPVLVALSLSIGPILASLQVFLSPSTQRHYAWVWRRLVVQIGRYLEAMGAAAMFSMLLVLMASFSNSLLLSSLLEYNLLRHLLSLVVVGIYEAGVATPDVMEGPVGQALANAHQQMGHASPSPGLPLPDFFLSLYHTDESHASVLRLLQELVNPSDGSVWLTVAVYYVPLVLVAWGTARVVLHHASEQQEAAARPAGLSEHVAVAGDTRASNRALPPLVAYVTTHTVLIAWYHLILSASGTSVGIIAASSSPLLMLGSMTLAIISHRMTRNPQALPLLFDS